MTYLGKEVGQGQGCPTAAKVQAILKYSVPQTRRELCCFLGMAGDYPGFCKNFAATSLASSTSYKTICLDSCMPECF